MENYTEEKVIGSGNYGEVCLVRSKKNGAVYCMKKIDWGNKSPQQQKESQNEVVVMSRLNHPNIVSFIEAFVEKKTLHIVMEYADNMDLEKYLIDKLRRRQLVPEGHIMRIFVQIALGLRQLHKQHLLHRDLKSANVFLTQDGGVKLGDFGFSKQLNYTMALASTVCGTPYYFSPELCQKMPYNNKADVWSLGVILYEMINLRKPFEARNLPELRKRVVNEEPAPFVATHISEDMKQLCYALLNKVSSSRPSVDAVLKMPYVRQYLGAFAESLEQQKEKYSQRSATIVQAHPRKPGEAPPSQATPSPPPGSSPAGKSKQKFDRATVAKAVAGGEVNIADPKTPSGGAGEVTQQLHHLVQPDAREKISNDVPLSVVNELHGALVGEQNCTRLKDDVDAVLYSDNNPNAGSGNNDVIGEAETDEERQLRDALGDKFVKAIELALLMADSGTTPEQAEKVLQQLKLLLKEKEYLLTDIQKVAMQFELDR